MVNWERTLSNMLFMFYSSWELFRLPDDFKNPEFSTVTIQRDLFYGYDTLMENVSDPSHIDFAHHKVNTLLSKQLALNMLPFYQRSHSSGTIFVMLPKHKSDSFPLLGGLLS